MDDVQNIVIEKTEPVASMLEQSNAMLNKLAGDDGRIQWGVQAMEQGAEEELICSHPEAKSGIEYPLKDLFSMLTEMSPQVNYLSYHLASFFYLTNLFLTWNYCLNLWS